MLIDPDRHPRLARTVGSSPRDPDNAWDPASDDLVEARNAHFTNSSDQMRDALGGSYDWLEGDLRVDDSGQLVMAHETDEEGDGLTLAQWLSAGRASERGLKVDVKELDALPGLLEALESSGVPQGRLMVNLPATSTSQVREIRRRLPDAWIAINPAIHEDGYHDGDLAHAARLADAAGGRIAFPLRWDLLTDDVIAALAPHGKVSVWASPKYGTPDDPDAERERLIERGVDGVIDLREPSNPVEKVAQFFVRLWESDAVRGVRGTVSGVTDGAVALARDGAGLVTDGIGAIGDLFD